MSRYDVRPPADAILSRIAPHLLDLFGSEGMAVGGGTALAARWGHRRSTDIDLIIAQTAFEEVAGQLTQRLTASSSVVRIRHGRNWLTGDCAEGDFSISTTQPLLPPQPGPPDRETRFGIKLEPTAEILARKLKLRIYGNGEFVSRDFYDLCTAAEEAPHALHGALSVLTSGERGEIAAEIAGFGRRAAFLGRDLTDVHRPEWLPSLSRRTAAVVAEDPRLEPVFHLREDGISKTDTFTGTLDEARLRAAEIEWWFDSATEIAIFRGKEKVENVRDAAETAPDDIPCPW